MADNHTFVKPRTSRLRTFEHSGIQLRQAGKSSVVGKKRKFLEFRIQCGQMVSVITIVSCNKYIIFLHA